MNRATWFIPQSGTTGELKGRAGMENLNVTIAGAAEGYGDLLDCLGTRADEVIE
jgi:hypothetical protein